MKQLPGVRSVRVAVEVFLGLTSPLCGLALATSIVQFPLAFLSGISFRDYVVPGLLMALADGGSALIAAALLLARQELGVLASALAGLMLLGFGVIEVTGIDRHTGNLITIVIALA